MAKTIQTQFFQCLRCHWFGNSPTVTTEGCNCPRCGHMVCGHHKKEESFANPKPGLKDLATKYVGGSK